MRVCIVGTAMRGPTCMADTERTWFRARTILDGSHQVGNFASAAA